MHKKVELLLKILIFGAISAVVYEYIWFVTNFIKLTSK